MKAIVAAASRSIIFLEARSLRKASYGSGLRSLSPEELGMRELRQRNRSKSAHSRQESQYNAAALMTNFWSLTILRTKLCCSTPKVETPSAASIFGTALRQWAL